MTVANIGGRKAASGFKKWGVRFIVIISIAWTIINWSALTEITDQLENVAIFLVLLAFSEACFIIGAILVAAGTGRVIFAGTGWHPLRWVRAIIQVRNTYQKFVADAPRSRMVRFGFHLNWFGALTTGVFAAAGIILVLPSMTAKE